MMTAKTLQLLHDILSGIQLPVGADGYREKANDLADARDELERALKEVTDGVERR